MDEAAPAAAGSATAAGVAGVAGAGAASAAGTPQPQPAAAEQTAVVSATVPTGISAAGVVNGSGQKRRGVEEMRGSLADHLQEIRRLHVSLRVRIQVLP